MNYVKLRTILNNIDKEEQLREFSKIYSTTEINGLHYVDFNSANNFIHIYTPSQELHYYSTCFLLKPKYDDIPINTLSSHSHEIRKFLDYLKFWEIDLLKVDLSIVLVGYVCYLRLLKIVRFPPNRAIEWSLLKKIPIHKKAEAFGKLSSIRLNKEGVMVQERFEDYPFDTIRSHIETACDYLKFLQDETHEYKNIDLAPIPIKVVYKTNKISGVTQRKISNIIFDVHAIMTKASFSKPKSSSNFIKPLSRDVMIEQDVKTFLSLIPSKDNQTKLLFYILKSFGIRRGEARNLMIPSKSIPKELYSLDFNEAKEWLLSADLGDISFDQNNNVWICHVEIREVTNFQSQFKSNINRTIPLLFPQDDLTNLLLEHLIERQIVMDEMGLDHEFLFYSNSNNSKGQPLTGGTIFSKYRSIIDGTETEEYYKKFSPHAFRHFFATHLIRIMRIPIYDVSKLLGHKDEKVTKQIYLHYLPDKDDNSTDSTAKDMIDTFRNDKGV